MPDIMIYLSSFKVRKREGSFLMVLRNIAGGEKCEGWDEVVGKGFGGAGADKVGSGW
jgi:hypothetical protein